jgi:hypothetical protein
MNWNDDLAFPQALDDRLETLPQNDPPGHLPDERPRPTEDCQYPGKPHQGRGGSPWAVVGERSTAADVSRMVVESPSAFRLHEAAFAP